MKIIKVGSCEQCPNMYLSEGYFNVWKCRDQDRRIRDDGEYPHEIPEWCRLENELAIGAI